MTRPSENKSFSAQDIERYHAGTMTSAERHALEKAALDDPFLADALEGYALAPTPAADLDALRSRLAARVEDRKVRPLFASRRSWLSAAALVVVLAGAAYFALHQLQPSARNVAAEKGVPTPERLTTDSTPAFNPAPTQATGSTADSTAVTYNFSKQAAPKSKVVARPGLTQLELHDVSSSMYQEPAATTADSSFYNTYNSKRKASEGEGALANSKGYNNVYNNANTRQMPAANAPQANNNMVYVNPGRQSNAATSTDAANEALFKSNRSDDTVRNVNVTMKPLDNQTAEVVVLNKRKDAFVQRSRLEGIRVDTLEPAEGWVKFDDYIASNLKTPEEIRSKPESSGAVVLSFDVNKQGQPVNITVVQSLCSRCDEEAIRLLKEGPKWKKKKGRGRVTIHF